MCKIKVLTVRKKDNNEIVWAVGIEEMNTIVYFQVKKNLFTDKEIAELTKDGAIVTEEDIFLGEAEAYHFLKDFENIVVKIESAIIR